MEIITIILLIIILSKIGEISFKFNKIYEKFKEGQ